MTSDADSLRLFTADRQARHIAFAAFLCYEILFRLSRLRYSCYIVRRCSADEPAISSLQYRLSARAPAKLNIDEEAVNEATPAARRALPSASTRILVSLPGMPCSK